MWQIIDPDEIELAVKWWRARAKGDKPSDSKFAKMLGIHRQDLYNPKFRVKRIYELTPNAKMYARVRHGLDLNVIEPDKEKPDGPDRIYRAEFRIRSWPSGVPPLTREEVQRLGGTWAGSFLLGIVIQRKNRRTLERQAMAASRNLRRAASASASKC